MNIYVGNLPYQTTEQDLEAAFRDYGEVSSVAVIRDKLSQKSKGFGFVEMPNSAEAQAAIDALNGQEMGGRTLTVNEARPRTERTDRDRRPPRGGAGRPGGDRRGW